MMRTEEISPQAAGTATSNTMTTSMAKKAENTSSAGDNRAYSDKRSREDRGSNSMSSTENRGCSKKLLCNRSR